MSQTQQNFELTLKLMGINHGALALDAENNYLNEHIQWLWEQAKKQESHHAK